MSKPAILIGMIGADIQASLAPAMHMQEGEELGLRYVYRLIDLTRLGLGVDALPSLLDAAERTGFDGLVVTHPCKQAVIPFLSELSEDARDLGAVNTIVFKEGSRLGHNTDWLGFAKAFRRQMQGVQTDRVVQLGAGGAGAAVAHAAMTLGVGHLTIFDVDRTRAQRVVGNITARFGEGRASVGADIAKSMQTADGLINATPVGMETHPGLPLPVDLLRPNLWVADVIYFPPETALLCHARAMSARTMNGGGMSVFQAAEQIRLFTGAEAVTERILAHFRSLQPRRRADAH